MKCKTRAKSWTHSANAFGEAFWSWRSSLSQLPSRRHIDPRYRLPEGVTVDADLVFSSPNGRDLRLDVFAPEGGAGAFPAVLFIQGSGHNGNNKVHFWREAAHLARDSFIAITICIGTESADLIYFAENRVWSGADDPPVLIMHSTADGTLPLQQAERFYRVARAAGVPAEFVPVEGGAHAMTNAFAYSTVLDRMKLFLARRLT